MKLLLILLTVLETLFSSLEQKTFQADFSLSVEERSAQPITYTGQVQMRGECFRLNVLSSEAAYDGKIYYYYSEDTDELTLSYPTEADLLSANPFHYAQQMRDACRITEQASKDGKSTIVTLVPNDASTSSVKRLTIVIRKADGMPTMIEVKEANATTRLTLRGQKWLATIPTWSIQHPGAYVNDLR